MISACARVVHYAGQLPWMASRKKFSGEIFTPGNPARCAMRQPSVVKICSRQIFDDAGKGPEGAAAMDGKPQKHELLYYVVQSSQCRRA